MPNNFTLTPKKVGEDAFVDFPFDTLFGPGVTVTVTLLITVYSGLPDTQFNMDAMRVGGATLAIDAPTRVAAGRVRDGQPGTTYDLTASATGNDGTKQHITFYLPVVEKRGG